MTRRTRRRGPRYLSKSLKRLKKALRKVAKDTNKIAASSVDKVGVKAIKFGLKPILKPRLCKLEKNLRKCLRGQKRNRADENL